MDSNSMAPMPMNKMRQPTSGINHCTGKVAATMPRAPVISIQELQRIRVAASNQRR